MIIRGKRALADVAPLLSKAEACGVDCAAYREGYSYLADTLDRFHREFFPDRQIAPDGTGIERPGE